jgi:hypothetical protein
MLATPFPLQARFEESLQNKPVPDQFHEFYKKWLRYYLEPEGRFFASRIEITRVARLKSLGHFL